MIELRLNGWKKRREDAGPKTIDQIHKEIEKEQLEQKLAHMAPMGPPPGRRDDRRNDRNDRNDDRRRSQKGGPGGKTYLRNIQQSSKLDADSMSFGPPKTSGGAGGFGTWGRGSQSAKTSRQEQVGFCTHWLVHCYFIFFFIDNQHAEQICSA